VLEGEGVGGKADGEIAGLTRSPDQSPLGQSFGLAKTGGAGGMPMKAYLDHAAEVWYITGR